MGFMTKYEFFDLFFNVLQFLKNTLKYYRLELANQKDDENSRALRIQNDLEASTLVPNMAADGVKILKHLWNQYPDTHCNIGMPSTKGGICGDYIYCVPNMIELRKVNAVNFCPLLFSSLASHVFYELLCNIYLERSIIFVTENLNLLTSSA